MNRRSRFILLAGLATFCQPSIAGAGVAAGVRISNVAQLSFLQGDARRSIPSNTVTTPVVEVLDVALAATGAGRTTVHADGAPQPLAFRLTNLGNGSEAFGLAAAAAPGADFQPSAIRIVVDAGGDGVFDPVRDPTYAPGAGDPVLAPGGSTTVWIVASAPPGVAAGAVGYARLTATAREGSGAPGTVLAGKGEGGVDAVVGLSGGAATAQGAYTLAQDTPPVELVKSQTVLDPAGGARPLPGAIVTYSLRARFSGSAPVADAELSDPIPTGATYVPGSLRLDGQALTDAQDADAGSIDAQGVAVSLGDVAAAAEHLVTFQVRINTNGGQP